MRLSMQHQAFCLLLDDLLGPQTLSFYHCQGWAVCVLPHTQKRCVVGSAFLGELLIKKRGAD